MHTQQRSFKLAQVTRSFVERTCNLEFPFQSTNIKKKENAGDRPPTLSKETHAVTSKLLTVFQDHSQEVSLFSPSAKHWIQQRIHQDSGYKISNFFYLSQNF